MSSELLPRSWTRSLVGDNAIPRRCIIAVEPAGVDVAHSSVKPGLIGTNGLGPMALDCRIHQCGGARPMKDRRPDADIDVVALLDFSRTFRPSVRVVCDN